MTWPVPQPFVANRADEVRRDWARSLGDVAAGLGQQWSIEPGGDPMWGFVSVVWPVRGPGGEPWVLKVGEQDDPRMRAEGSVLLAWQGLGVVEVVRHDPATGALLLEALDPTRDLYAEPDVDAATTIVGRSIANLAHTTAPAGVPSVADELRRMRASTLPRRDLVVRGLTRRDFDVALDTFATVTAEIETGGPWSLLHGDLHYANVLHTLDGVADPGWRVIDPLPMRGPVEVEVIASLRGRWEDALATGNPDRALRRRLDQLVDLAGLDLSLARALCQAVAVDNVSWIALERPVAQDRFLGPYSVMAAWR
jgi:streptomycin 6-kinase